MTWRVEFHPRVLDEDLPALDREGRRQVLKAIRKKLTAAPDSYGEPLRKELFGYWKIRVWEYRVIYRIHQGTVTVFVLKIGMRRDSEVYRRMLTRLQGVIRP